LRLERLLYINEFLRNQRNLYCSNRKRNIAAVELRGV
jgi:hypothetical protein